MAVLFALAALLGLGLTAAAVAVSKKSDTSTVTTQTTSINNGGNTPNCGASCDQSHNPTDFTKSCTPVPGNGCHRLPDTPCERGHGGTEIGNKHCGPALTVLKEQSSSEHSGFTHDVLTAPLFSQVYYRITVTNLTSTQYTLVADDPVCNEVVGSGGLDPLGPQTLVAGGTVQYTCWIDTVPGYAGIPGNATTGNGPYTLTNTVSVTATPDGGGSAVTLTDTVSASLN